MRSLAGLLATALLCVFLTACGSGNSTSSASRPSSATVAGATGTTSTSGTETIPSYTRVDGDKDNDTAGPTDDKNNNEILNFGHAASTPDTRAVTALIKRYYTVAVTGDGATACSMLYATLKEAVAEDYGHGSSGPTFLRQGTTCPTVMDLWFKHYHTQLQAELPVLKVTHVRLKHRQGLAVLSFGGLPERQISIRQEKHAWKLEGLADSELP